MSEGKKSTSNLKPDKQNKNYENRTMKLKVPKKGKRTPPGQKK